jgi:hypothetical protein
MTTEELEFEKLYKPARVVIDDDGIYVNFGPYSFLILPNGSVASGPPKGNVKFDTNVAEFLQRYTKER